MICSASKLDYEVEFITGTLCSKDFPEDIVRSVIRGKISDFSKIKLDSVQRCTVYLRLLWIGDINDRFANHIFACVRKCYFSSNQRVVFRTWTVLKSGRKDAPHHQYSGSMIYSFICVCGLQCIGRTNKRLDSKIKHVLTIIRQGNFADLISNTYGSSISEHLINNRNCTSFYCADLFTSLSKSYSDYHLKVLEAIHILTHKPSLCKQRECLLGLNLSTIWYTSSFLVKLHLLSSSTLHSACPLSFLNRCPRFNSDQGGLKPVSYTILFKKVLKLVS